MGLINHPDCFLGVRQIQNNESTTSHLHLSDAFIQSDLQLHSGYTFLIIMCVPWESNPQPFALLTQCSTTEPHRNIKPKHNHYYLQIVDTMHKCINVNVNAMYPPPNPLKIIWSNNWPLILLCPTAQRICSLTSDPEIEQNPKYLLFILCHNISLF